MAEHTCSGGTFADVRLLLSTDIYLGRVKATPLVGPAEGSARVPCRLAAVNTIGRFLDVILAAVWESQLRGSGGCCARYGPCRVPRRSTSRHPRVLPRSQHVGLVRAEDGRSSAG